VIWGEYEGVLRSAVLALKHRGRDEFARPLGQRLTALVAAQPWAPEIELVTAVPSHWLHRLRRSWAAAELLARVTAKALGVRFTTLLRRRGVARQARRTRAQRLQLPGRSFSARSVASGRSILLVDDVTTTGSTLRRASQALLEVGAKAVYCAALARTADVGRLP
jgi:predicted amidophosphoribosyltransferase